MKSKATVMIVDDHPLFRKGLTQLLALEDDLDVVAEFNNGLEAIDFAHHTEPDLIILDLNMPDIDGLMTTKKLRQQGTASRIVLLTVSDHEDDLLTAIEYGADGYLLKDMEPEDIVENIKQAVLGKLALTDRLTQVLAKTWQQPKKKNTASIDSLTNREYEILTLLGKGMSNKLIGQRLSISDSTVKVHVRHVLKKLDLRSRLEAALWLVEHQKH
ncbi:MULTISPECIES: two-component system response regulator NarL [unclassified Vibrio]|uniref:Two-component system response regulator NarL n=1 Tax=Vibrio sp. HB236076 TaxID=3232307 RepID=A0AB39HIY1_9VIBR|nr:two-component system response regulator NarL [Vibrio sp. HB161653]MDP5254648.1 two-component system response regulator NarL [Vibrio sp. HB161653]